MKYPLRRSLIAGFALFSMFFGAGNVVFPPQLGYPCGGAWGMGFLTYYLADIGLALLALTAVLRCGEPEQIVSVSSPILSVVYPPVLLLVLLSFLEERLPPRLIRMAAPGALPVGLFTAISA